MLAVAAATHLAVSQPFVRCSLQCRDLVDEAKKFHLRPELRSQMQGPRTRARLGKLAPRHGEGTFASCPLLGGRMEFKEHSVQNPKSSTRFRALINCVIADTPLHT